MVLQFLEHLLQRRILADHEIIADAIWHEFKDARTGRRYQYRIHQDNTFELEAIHDKLTLNEMEKAP